MIIQTLLVKSLGTFSTITVLSISTSVVAISHGLVLRALHVIIRRAQGKTHPSRIHTYNDGQRGSLAMATLPSAAAATGAVHGSGGDGSSAIATAAADDDSRAEMYGGGHAVNASHTSAQFLGAMAPTTHGGMNHFPLALATKSTRNLNTGVGGVASPLSPTSPNAPLVAANHTNSSDGSSSGNGNGRTPILSPSRLQAQTSSANTTPVAPAARTLSRHQTSNTGANIGTTGGTGMGSIGITIGGTPVGSRRVTLQSSSNLPSPSPTSAGSLPLPSPNSSNYNTALLLPSQAGNSSSSPSQQYGALALSPDGIAMSPLPSPSPATALIHAAAANNTNNSSGNGATGSASQGTSRAGRASLSRGRSAWHLTDKNSL